MTVLSIHDLSVTFSTEGGDLHALKDVSFEVPEHRIVGIVGESGCGKSTLINAILGLLADNGRVSGGEILFQGRDLCRLAPREMKALRGPQIATVFQDPMGALNPVISVGRQMANIQYRSGLSKAEKVERTVAMLRRVRIPDPEAALARFPHQFSGGMKQRIAIAMALMMEPALLIADEPTTALDVTVQAQIMELLQDLQKEIGMAIVLITHDLGVVAEVADSVAVMYAGRVVESGKVREVLGKPAHPYTVALLDSVPHVQHDGGKLHPILGSPPDMAAAPSGCAFHPRCRFATDVCSESQPTPSSVAPGRKVECHHAERVFNGG
jgi:oligopeptide/dipeptide ABC transporter ATP-binding protein